MSFIKYYISFFTNRIYWAKTIKSIQENNDLDAYIFINKMNQKRVKNSVNYFIIRAFIYFSLERYENALIDCDKSLQLLERKKSKLNESEYQYLQKYIFFIVCNSHKILGHNSSIKCFKKFNKITYKSSDVSPRFLRLFPQKNSQKN